MATFTAPDGVRLQYEIEGHGPPLVLHLGAACDAGLWREAGYIDVLTKKYSCILFNHRGHGKSDHPTSAVANHLDRYADKVAALVLFGPIARRATAEQLAAGSKMRVAELRSKGWWFLLDDMTAAQKHPVPQWTLDRITATDIEPYIAWSEARPTWNWSPWDALPLIESPTPMIEAALLMPNATRIRIPDREHINAFLSSELALPHVMAFLGRHASR